MRRSLKKVMAHRDKGVAVNDAANSDSMFIAIYDAHVEEVYRFVHRRCRDHSLAEDITQETFMAAIRSTDDLNSITIGWLMTVARNRLFDVLRRQVRYEDKLRLLAAGTAEENSEDLVERLRIEAALNGLRVEHRLVLTLHYMDGLTVPAMAERLGRSVKSVEGLITRARRELRMKLDIETDEMQSGGASHG